MNLLAWANETTQEGTLLSVLIQVVVIIVVSRLFAAAFRWIRQPAVMGEIVAGLMLGPSFLGSFFPAAFQALFDPAAHEIFSVLSQLGLILLLFLVGLEFDFRHLRWHSNAALAISLSGMIAPFMLGASLAPWLYPDLEVKVPFTGFVLFMGIAMSITAIPVLGRIMLELGIARTRIGTVTMAAAAVDDALGWILLATVASMVQSQFQLWLTLKMIATTVLFFLAMRYVLRPGLKYYLQHSIKKSNGEVGPDCFAVVLIALFLSSLATSLIGIFAILGAFVCGTMLSDEDQLRVALNAQLRNVVTVFFVPIFFTYTGLRTDIGTLESASQWLWLGVILTAAIVGKWAGCGVAARLAGFPKREALCIGVMMNARGLMELVVVNVGRDLGIIAPSIYCMLVLMALVTTLMTTPILVRLMPGTELEQPILKSRFLHSGKVIPDHTSG